MTKEEAQQVWAAASEYRWRGFDHWWKEEGSRGPPPLYTPVPTSCREFENVNIGIYDNNRRMKETIEWIKTGDVLPSSYTWVLICPKNRDYVDIGVYDYQHENWDIGDNTDRLSSDHVTHWAELPKGPKEGKE